MFKPGDRVVCIEGKLDFMDKAMFSTNKIYTIKEHVSLEEYQKRHLKSDWWLKGKVLEEWKCGLVYLEEVLGADGSDLEWLADKFKPAE
ncbi:MAG: hypothetical protein Q7S73_01535 [bacterium]|nr:hypothetical protein [bacterium]